MSLSVVRHTSCFFILSMVCCIRKVGLLFTMIMVYLPTIQQTLEFFQLRYQFEVSNTLGSVKGSMALIVHEGEGEDETNPEQKFESNPVSQAEFGEYVASLHSHNNSTFILQYEVCIANNHTNQCTIACTSKFIINI